MIGEFLKLDEAGVLDDWESLYYSKLSSSLSIIIYFYFFSKVDLLF